MHHMLGVKLSGARTARKDLEAKHFLNAALIRLASVMCILRGGRVRWTAAEVKKHDSVY